MGEKCMDVEEFPSQVNILKSPTKRKEGLACNLYSHQVGAISIAEEGRKNGEMGYKRVGGFFFSSSRPMVKNKRRENQRQVSSRKTKTKKQV